MNVADMKELEEQVASGPWESKWDGTLGHGSVYVPKRLDISISRFGYGNASPEAPYIAAMRNLAPELLDLWEAANLFYITPSDSVDGWRACQDLGSAIERLNDKAASMAV